MTHAELINAIATATHTPTQQVAKTLDGFRQVLTAQLKVGEVVTITNVATFYVARRTARVGRNPRTGAAILVRAMKKTRAKFSASLNAALN